MRDRTDRRTEPIPRTVEMAARFGQGSSRQPAMNVLMNRLIDELGDDDGSFLPPSDRTPWHVDRWGH